MISDYLFTVESENFNNKDFKGNSYHVSIDDQDFKFIESELSPKW